MLAAPFACPPPPPPATLRADRPRYALNVRVAESLRAVTGDVAVAFTPNRPTDRLVFRLWPNAPPSRARLQVDDVTSPDRHVRVARRDPTTLVVRTGEIAPGERVRVRLTWRLSVPTVGFDRIARFRGGLRLGSFFPILAWDPRRGWVIDPPARILGENSTSPTADFRLRVTVPRGYTSLASEGHAVRDVAVAVGRFRIARVVARVPAAVSVRVAVARGARGDAGVLVRLAKQALERLARRYGSYPWRSYTIVVPPDIGVGGIEYPTLTYVGTGGPVRVVIDHETAHQWFYSLVGNDQARDPWLDETLATWAQQRVDGQVRPPRRPVPRAARRHVGAPMTYWRRFPRAYFYGVYEEGASALRSLRNDAAVDCALRAYAARHAYGIAQPGDLLDALNRFIPGAERRLRAWGIRR